MPPFGDAMNRSLPVGLLVWSLALSPAAGQTPEQKQATVAYLQRLHAPTGGYGPSLAAAPQPTLSATLSALRAVRYFGGTVANTEPDAKFVVSCFDKNAGGFADRPGQPPAAIPTAIGAMAAVDLKMSVDMIKDAVVRYLGENVRGVEEIRVAAAAVEALQAKSPRTEAWLQQVAAVRNSDGTYGEGPGKARATGGTVVLVMRLGGEVEGRPAVLRTLRAGQRPDGGWGKADQEGSDLESSYRVMRAFVRLGEKPSSVEKLREFIGKCRNADGGYGVAPGQESSASGTYYAGIIQHWLGGGQ
jgi:prenyltransferase beta subunit